MSTEALFDSLVDLFPRTGSSAPTALSGAFGIRDVIKGMEPDGCELTAQFAAAGAWFAPHVRSLNAGAELSVWLTETLIGTRVGNRVVVYVGKHGRARLYRVDRWPGPGPVGDSAMASLVQRVGQRWSAALLVSRGTLDAAVFDLLSKLCGFSAITDMASLAQWLERRVGRVWDGFEVVREGTGYLVGRVGEPVAAVTQTEAPKRQASKLPRPWPSSSMAPEIPADNSDLL